jgi:hypothetical protein
VDTRLLHLEELQVPNSEKSPDNFQRQGSDKGVLGLESQSVEDKEMPVISDNIRPSRFKHAFGGCNVRSASGYHSV